MNTGRLARACLCAAIMILLLPPQAHSGGGADRPKGRSIAVFVPGIVSGSPVYEMLVAGVTEAVTAANARGEAVSLTVVEAGTRQADWGTRMTALVAEGRHGLIVTSNPAMPEILEPVAKRFPNQDFLVLDAWHTGTPGITTFRYNQREQAYISGYMAALVSKSSMPHANREAVIGLIAGQEYPAMTRIILPAFLEGARAVDPAFRADFRVVGNWYDAAKAADLARAMKRAGCDVIMPISGGANQGVVAAAKEDPFYLAWFDDNGYAKAPGLVVSSSVMAQERLAREKTSEWIAGTLRKGVPSTVGLRDGYVSFVSDDERYLATVPREIRARMDELVSRISSGTLSLPVE